MLWACGASLLMRSTLQLKGSWEREEAGQQGRRGLKRSFGAGALGTPWGRRGWVYSTPTQCRCVFSSHVHCAEAGAEQWRVRLNQSLALIQWWEQNKRKARELMGARMIIKTTHKTEALQGGRQGPDGGENMVWSMACRFGETKGLLELGFRWRKLDI